MGTWGRGLGEGQWQGWIRREIPALRPMVKGSVVKHGAWVAVAYARGPYVPSWHPIPPLASWWPTASGVCAVVGSSPRRDFPPPGHRVGCQLGQACSAGTGQPGPKKTLPKCQKTSTTLDAVYSLQLPANLTHQGKGQGLLNLQRSLGLGPPGQCT